MSATCQSCAAPSGLFLCNRCVGDLRTLLADFGWWIRQLHAEAIGDVRKSDGGRGSTRREPFKGDDHAIVSAKDRAVMLRRFLAAGRVNERAASELDNVRNTLTTWCRHIAESRGIAFVRPTFIGPLLAGDVRMGSSTPELIAFLRLHVQAIACDEAAGECVRDLNGHMRRIEHIVNRPVPMRDLGRCPTWDERKRMACGTELRCREGTIQITCPACRQTHNTDRLQLLRMNDLMRFPVPWDNIIKANKTQPEGFSVPEPTLRRWRAEGKIKVRGYRRADGRKVINRHSDDDVPLYLWSDITRLRAERPRKVAR